MYDIDLCWVDDVQCKRYHLRAGSLRSIAQAHTCSEICRLDTNYAELTTTESGTITTLVDTGEFERAW